MGRLLGLNTIKNLRQQDEQPSSRPILPSYQTRQRPFQERQWKWHTWSDSSSTSSAWTGSQSWWACSKWEDHQTTNDLTFHKEFRLQEMAVLLSAMGDLNSTPHLKRITRAIFSRAWVRRTGCIFSVCCLPQLSSSRAHVMFRTLLDPPLSSTQSTPTSSSLLYSQNRTLVWPFC